MTYHSEVKRLWDTIVRFFKIFLTARISIIMVILSAILFFTVSQAKDAIIALGNFAAVYQFIITSIAGLLWALLIWYWARVFYYMEYFDESLQPWERAIAIHTPRLLGALSLVILGGAFLSHGISLFHEAQVGAIHLIIFGSIYFIYAIIFLFFVYFRRTIFKLQTDIINITHGTEDKFVLFKNLPIISRILLITSTIFFLIILILLLIWPITLTIFLGDAVTILILSLSIWLPVLYWILFGSKRTGLPLYLFLIIIIAIFSLFNSNKNVRIMNNPKQPVHRTESLYEYYDNLYKARFRSEQKDNRVPLIFVLSEGGGIRAAYWGAGFLSALHEKYDFFSEYIFGIYGISGGSFGGTVFDTLVKFYKDNPGLYEDNNIRELAGDIVGKDYLSPMISAMFTREIVQMIIPFPLADFDYAKVFEKTWEYHWNNAFRKMKISGKKNSVSFSSPFTSIWIGDNDYEIPRLFLGTTRVEDGSPYVISNIKLDLKKAIIPQWGITKDFYWFTDDIDIPVSTASLLSARFPYFGPAGTCKLDNNFAGFVDGGYFDNTGANTAYNNLVLLKNSPEKKASDVGIEQSILRKQIIPIVIYIKNGSPVSRQTYTGPKMLYQAAAPVDCVFNTREAHSDNALDLLEEYIKLFDGIFATISLASLDDSQTAAFDIPLGWALSHSVQIEIDKRIDYILAESNPSQPFLNTQNDKDKEEIEKLKKILTLISKYEKS